MIGWLRTLIGTPVQAHAVHTPDAYRQWAKAMRASHGLPVALLPSSEQPPAYVNDGRWVVDCLTQGCNNGPSAHPEWQLAICPECGTEYRPRFPADWRAVERELLRCPFVELRDFYPDDVLAARYGLPRGQTLADLAPAVWWHHSWTAPRTWSTGELVTASIMNTHVRDNQLETAPAKITTAGDLVYGTGANALTRLGIGTNGDGLIIASGVPAWSQRKTAIGGTYQGNGVSNGTQYVPVWLYANSGSATEANVALPVPFAGTARNLRVVTTSTQPNDGSLVFTLRQAGSDTALVATVAANAAAGTFSDLSNAIAFTAAQLWDFKLVNAAAGTSAGIAGLTFEFYPTS